MSTSPGKRYNRNEDSTKEANDARFIKAQC